MRFLPTPLEGVVVVESEPVRDDRGSFARIYEPAAFVAAGLSGRLEQWNVSYNRDRGTLRGMHWQVEPHAEVKLVRCSRGRVFDVAVDVREDSAQRYAWWGLELDPHSGRSLYLPPGFAHGFLTLEDDCEVQYVMTATYSPQHARGLRYDDPACAIAWPAPVTRVSERDLAFPLVGA